MDLNERGILASGSADPNARSDTDRYDLRRAAHNRNFKFYVKNGNGHDSKEVESFIRKRVMAGRVPTTRSLIKQETKRHNFLNDESDETSSDDLSDDSDDDDDDEKVKKDFDLSYSIVHTMLSYQFSLARRAWRMMLHAAAKSGKSIIYQSIPKSQVMTFLSFTLYTYVVDSGFLRAFIPLALFVYSMSTMVTSTLQAVHGERHFQKFIAWSDSLRSVDALINTKEAEENYIIKHQTPIRRFLAGLFGTVTVYPFCYSVVPSSYLSIISFAMFGISLWSFSGVIGFPSITCLLLIITVFIVRMYKLFYSGALSLLFFGFLRVNFALDALLRVLVLLFYLAIPFTAKKEKGVIVSKQVIMKRDYTRQAFLCLWLELALLFVKSSSSVGELATAFSYVAITVFFFPVACAWTAYHIFMWLLTMVDAHIIAAMIVAVAVSLLVVYFKPKLRRYTVLVRERIVEHKLMLITVFVTVTLLSSAGENPSVDYDQSSKLSLDDYTRVCLKNFTVASEDLACRHLVGLYGNWKGVVEKVEVVSVENKARDLANQLPSALADRLACVPGDSYPDSCSDSQKSPYLCDISGVNVNSGRQCHLDRYNTYNFRLSVWTNHTTNMTILADHDYEDVMFKIVPDDEIEFHAVVHGTGTELNLVAITSLNGKNLSVESEGERMMALVAVECAFNFIFSPALKIQYGPSGHKCAYKTEL